MKNDKAGAMIADLWAEIERSSSERLKGRRIVSIRLTTTGVCWNADVSWRSNAENATEPAGGFEVWGAR